MKADAAMFAEVGRDGVAEPRLRLYRWLRPTLSLGRNQKQAEVIDADAVARLGYDVVTRPTGGRALLHKGDLCYALAARRSWHPEFRSLSSTYRAVSRAIVSALAALGISVATAAPAGKERRSANPCFAIASAFEVSVNGRKICGSAQYRSRDCFLQHGSLRVRDNWSDDDLRSLWPAGIGLSAEQITCVDKELGLETGFRRVEEELLAALREVFAVQISEAGLKR
jgi:lipoate-protein ligase A